MKISTHITILTLLIISISGCDRIFNGSLNQSPKEMATNMVTEPVSNINPSKLCPIFTYDSNYTDLQRETIENDIKGKTVQWKLQVYEVRSTNHQDVFRIQTRECIPESSAPAFNQLEKDILSALKNLGGDLGASIASSLEVNRNVSTNIDLVVLNENDRNRLHQLKTDDWIVVRGRISGVFLRSIQLEPAVFSDSIQFINQSSKTQNQSALASTNNNSVSRNVMTNNNEVLHKSESANSPRNSSNNDKVSYKDLENLISKTARLSTTPIDASYSSDSWMLLNKVFPGAVWSDLNDNRYTDSKYFDPFDNISIHSRGARTMIFESELVYTSSSDTHDLYKILNKFNLTDPRCDQRESAMHHERYGQVSFQGLKPTNFRYEYSTGASGGIQLQVITFGRDIELPRIGAKSDISIWTSFCN